MKRNLIPILLVVGATGLTSACSTEFFTEPLSPDAAAGTEVNGIPFRLSQPHLLTVYQKTAYGYVRVAQIRENLPNQNQIYVLGLDGNFLSDATLKVDLKGDGTLALVQTSDVSSKVDEAITELGKAIGAVDEKIEAEKKAKAEAKDKEKQVSDTKLDAQSEALSTKLEADRLQADYDALGEDATVAQRQQALKDLLVKKYEANVAYQKLGQASPFPEVAFP